MSTPSGSRPVFNLTTSDGTYFANGVLVHNCDAGSQAIKRLGIMPLLAGNVFGDTTDEYDYDDWSISPY